MITKAKHAKLLKEKQEAIDKLKSDFEKTQKKIIQILKLPEAKRPSTAMKRAWRAVNLAIEAKFIHQQILIIQSQPLPPIK